MNLEKMQADFDAEIAEAERACTGPVACDEAMTIDDVKAIIDARLIGKIKVHGMKVEHAIMFGSRSPYFGLL